MCLNHKSESRCTYGEKCRFRHVEAGGQPSKVAEKWCERISCLIKGVCTIGLCVSRVSTDKVSSKRGNWDEIALSTSPRAGGNTLKLRKEKGPSRGVTQKCEPHKRYPCDPKFEERTQDETLHEEGCSRRAAWDLAKNVYELQNTDTATFYSPIEASPKPAPISKITRGTRIRG